MSQDFYQILGVTHNATEHELNHAHRRLALQYHPDKNRAPDALVRFQEIQCAYEVLINKEKRQAYDQVLAARTNASHDKCSQNVRLHRFDESGTNYFAMRGPSGGGSGDHVEIPPGVYRLHVPLERLFKGGLAKVTIATCSRGNARDQELPGKELTVILRIAKGQRDGETMTYSPSGHPVPKSTPGAATFVVFQKPHSLFERRNDNLVFRYTLLESQASAGCTIQVPLIEGGTMPLTLAAGEVNSDTMVCISGKGMPRTCWQWWRGDLLVEFDVVPHSPMKKTGGTSSKTLWIPAALLAAVGPLAALAYWYYCWQSS